MNTFPFNKPPLTTGFNFNSTPYTSKNIIDEIAKKPKIVELKKSYNLKLLKNST